MRDLDYRHPGFVPFLQQLVYLVHVDGGAKALPDPIQIVEHHGDQHQCLVTHGAGHKGHLCTPPIHRAQIARVHRRGRARLGLWHQGCTDTQPVGGFARRAPDSWAGMELGQFLKAGQRTRILEALDRIHSQQRYVVVRIISTCRSAEEPQMRRQAQ